jgi:hypothetical protein
VSYIHKIFVFIIMALLGFGLFTQALAATLLINSDGQLTGATRIDVNGVFLDVAFVDSTCAILFRGCDETSDFPFSSITGTEDRGIVRTEAVSAGEALFEQVFIDSALGNFDSQPGLTSGCAAIVQECFLRIPTDAFLIGSSLGIGGIFVINAAELVSPREDGFAGLGSEAALFANFDLSTSDDSTFAVFSISEVPVPPAIILLITGISGIRLARRWSHHNGRSVT